MDPDLATTLRVLSHELRTPVGVLQGYLRMLSEGRLPTADQPRIFTQMQTAATRVASLGQQASEISRWLDHSIESAWTSIPVSQLVERAVSTSAAASRVMPELDGQSPATVRTFDAPALTTAFASVVNAVARESAGTLTIVGRPSKDHDGSVELLIAPTAPDLRDVPGPDDPQAAPLRLEYGGVGLSLVLSSAVVHAHGGQVWQLPDRPAFFGIRLLEAR
jgi:K+-sensing histidine kinase KdpD